MSDHAKFYQDCDAEYGDWLAVDAYSGATVAFACKPTLCVGAVWTGPIKGVFDDATTHAQAPEMTPDQVCRNGIIMHCADTLWEVPLPSLRGNNPSRVIVDDSANELTNEQRLVIYCAARDVQRGKSMRHRGEHKRLQALADYALVLGPPEQHRVLCDKADRHRIAADRFGTRADHWNRRACVIRKRIK